MKIDEDVLAIISDCSFEDDTLKINSGQLDRKMYLEVNKILEAIGGKWNRKAKGHVGITEDRLEQLLLTGEVEPPKKFGYFPTPKTIVDMMIEEADIRKGHEVLEPSAGQGAILDQLNQDGLKITCVELLEDNRKILEEKGYVVSGVKDFMEFKARGWDRIIMNPPFEKQQDIDHVLHAYDLLKEGGKLASVMSNGVTFRKNKKTVDFYNLLLDKGYLFDLPEDSFKETGTRVKTVLVTLEK